MWFLKSNTGSYIYLKPGQTLTFGRVKSDIVISDQSVSKVHGSVTVTPKQELLNSETTSTCTLKDLGSKYGTYIMINNEGKEVPNQATYELKDKDVIRFGVRDAVYTVTYVPFVVVTSGLKESDKVQLTSLVDEIDGFVSESWTPHCTHLSVENATLTEKVALAMLSLKSIVTIDYWSAVKRAINSATQLPNPEDYVPSVGEKFVHRRNVSFLPDKKRQELFKDLIFVFFTRHQHRSFGRLVGMGGGKSLLYGTKKLTVKQLCLSNVVVIQYDNDVGSQATQTIISDYDEIYEALQGKERRMIPETEILLAILDCSVKEYCNPRYNFGDLLKRQEPLQQQQQPSFLAEDSQDVQDDSKFSLIKCKMKLEPEVKVIQETLDYLVRKDSENETFRSVIVKKSTASNCFIPETQDIVIPETLDSMNSGASSVVPDTQESKVKPVASFIFPDESEPIESSAPRQENVDKKIEPGKPSASSSGPRIKAECELPEFKSPPPPFRLNDNESPASPSFFEEKIIPETPYDTNDDSVESSQVPKDRSTIDSDRYRNVSDPTEKATTSFGDCRSSKDGFLSGPDTVLRPRNTIEKTSGEWNVRKVPPATDESTTKENVASKRSKVRVVEEKLVRLRRKSSSETNGENAENGENRSEIVQEDEFIPCVKKSRFGDVTLNDNSKSDPFSNRSDTDQNCKRSINSSLLRYDLGYKPFKKVYRRLPPTRISFKEVTAWTTNVASAPE